MSDLTPTQEYLATILEDFDPDNIIMILGDLADLPEIEQMFTKSEMINGYRKLVHLTENNQEGVGEFFSNFVYDRYRSLRSELGHEAMVNLNPIMEKEEESRDTEETKRKKMAKDAEEKGKADVQMKKKAEKAPLAQAIRSKGEDQSDAADKLDVDKSTISRIKTGTRKPSFDLMKKMSRNYGKGLISQLLSKS